MWQIIWSMLARWRPQRWALAGSPIASKSKSCLLAVKIGYFFPGKLNIKQDWRSDTRTMDFLWNRRWVLLEGWPENTDPRSVEPPTDPVRGLPYGPVHGSLLRTPPTNHHKNKEKCGGLWNSGQWWGELNSRHDALWSTGYYFNTAGIRLLIRSNYY